MSTIVSNPAFGIPSMPVRRFSVAEYHQMIDAGILTEDDSVELLEGWIVPKMTRKPPHDTAIQVLSKVLARLVPPGWDVRIQMAITTSDSEPEPDLAVVRGDEWTYSQKHPAPGDVGVVIEVADATLGQDRKEKARIYARAGIPHYWIVNLVDGWIEAYTDPTSHAGSAGYQTRVDHRPGDSLALILDGQTAATLAVPALPR